MLGHPSAVLSTKHYVPLAIQGRVAVTARFIILGSTRSTSRNESRCCEGNKETASSCESCSPASGVHSRGAGSRICNGSPRTSQVVSRLSADHGVALQVEGACHEASLARSARQTLPVMSMAGAQKLTAGTARVTGHLLFQIRCNCRTGCCPGDPLRSELRPASLWYTCGSYQPERGRAGLCKSPAKVVTENSLGGRN